MLTEKMQIALNKQIIEELDSAYIYLQIAAESDRLGLPGFVNWFKLQYNEELAHADRFFNYVLERNGEVKLESIPKPELGDETPLSLFEKALAHEQHITGCIFSLKDLARSESDHATDVFLEWFVNEQVEEEATVSGIIAKLRMVNDDGYGLLMIDNELGNRSEPPPVPQ